MLLKCALTIYQNIMLKCLIVEDNLSFALELEIILKKIGYEILNTVDNSGDAVVEILSSKPDLIFMDIDIKGKLSGLEIAEKVAHLNIPILFITSFADEDHYNLGSKIPNSTYLTKPVDEFTIRSAVNLLTKISYSLLTSKDTSSDFKVESNILYLKKNENFFAIKQEDILLIESNSVYCRTITVSNENYLNRMSLNEYANILSSENFIRPHRSYIINVNHITRVSMNENLITLGDHKVPLSRAAKKEFKSIFHMFS